MSIETNNKQPFKEHYENGQLKERGTHIDGIKNGHFDRLSIINY